MRILKIALTTAFVASFVGSVIFSLVLTDGIVGTLLVFIPIFGAYLILLGLIESVGGMKKMA